MSFQIIVYAGALFKNIEHVQIITDQWIEDYNHHRPHESLGNLTPI